MLNIVVSNCGVIGIFIMCDVNAFQRRWLAASGYCPRCHDNAAGALVGAMTTSYHGNAVTSAW